MDLLVDYLCISVFYVRLYHFEFAKHNTKQLATIIEFECEK